MKKISAVLLLTNSQNCLSACSYFLAQRGFSVCPFRRWQEMMLKYGSCLKQFDFVLVDRFLPDTTGMVAVTKIRSCDKEIKIFLTAEFESMVGRFEERVVASGANGFLPRPFTDKAFKKMLRSAGVAIVR